MLSPASLSYLSVEKVIFIRKGHIGKKEQKNKGFFFLLRKKKAEQSAQPEDTSNTNVLPILDFFHTSDFIGTGAVLGDTIVASVKEAFPRGKVKKGEVVYGVVVRAAMKHNRLDGSEIVFDDNAVVLVNKQGEPIGTRISGPVPYELRKKHVKILALADNVV